MLFLLNAYKDTELRFLNGDFFYKTWPLNIRSYEKKNTKHIWSQWNARTSKSVGCRVHKVAVYYDYQLVMISF
jgi:hypothetical protein